MTPPIDDGPVGIDYDPGPCSPGSPAEEVMLKHEGRLMALPGVTGIGVGQNAIGEDAILVYVREKAALEQLPRQLDGFDVVTEITGEIDAY